LSPGDVKNECGPSESKMCVITTQEDNNIAAKYKKDPFKFY